MMNKPIRITVTGAAGRVAHALLFRLGSGAMLGSGQPLELVLFDLPRAKKAILGVMMALQDCAFPLLSSVVATDDPVMAFSMARIALLISARARSAGMDRLDLLADNAKIFKVQGVVIGQRAHSDCKVLVVVNPCNTNADAVQHAAAQFGRIPPRNVAALLRLDHNRALSMLARRATAAPTTSTAAGASVSQAASIGMNFVFHHALQIMQRMGTTAGAGVSGLVTQQA